MLPLYDELENGYPEVKHATRFDWGRMHSLIKGNHKFNKEGIYVDPDFLQMFTFDLIKGNPKTALNELNSIVLTAIVLHVQRYGEISNSEIQALYTVSKRTATRYLSDLQGRYLEKTGTTGKETVYRLKT